MPDAETTSPEIVEPVGPALIEITGIRLTQREWYDQCRRAGYPGRQPPQDWYEDQGELAGPTGDAE